MNLGSFISKQYIQNKVRTVLKTQITLRGYQTLGQEKLCAYYMQVKSLTKTKFGNNYFCYTFFQMPKLVQIRYISILMFFLKNLQKYSKVGVFASGIGLPKIQNCFGPYNERAKWDIAFKVWPDIHKISNSTVLVLIKLTKLAVALLLRCGSCKLIFLHYLIIFR